MTEGDRRLPKVIEGVACHGLSTDERYCMEDGGGEGGGGEQCRCSTS